MQSNQRSFLASVDIGPSLFVKVGSVGGSNHAQASLAGAITTAAAYGVSHEGTREAPIPGVTPLAAAAGESCTIYGPGDNCEVIANATIAAGDYLKPDANSKAVVAVTGDVYSALAISSAAAGQKVKVCLVRGTMHA